jgi:hypothetical protein
MKKAKIFDNGIPAGEIDKIERGKKYRFIYLKDYKGQAH